MKAADVRIVYHVLIRHAAYPFNVGQDSDLAGPMARLESCPTSPSEWHLHHRHWRVYGGGHVLSNLELLHANCHRQVHSQGSETERSCVPRGASVEGLSCVSGN